ncbi:CRAL/TRIO domain-containing protein [Suillus clintonianus]|uniref:CRAL/TRIO domain-containing protein n=1 Tax=Suillus clintonianus TaxID=1904413 RepID=UPI001B869401|nr:CRAL/TRIO domain-containing protein [Suillus clintonianus]KAG2115458.1 CRAL/TRIO domain-containing protein [Suillus clintonianus]
MPDAPHSSPEAAIIPIPVSDNRGQSLEAFKSKLRDAGLYQPPSDDTPASHDDSTLLRFLRARQYDVDKAQKQFSDTEAWRKQHNVDELFRTFETNEMESARIFYPRWTGRRDKTGLPVYVYRLASLDAPLRKELESAPSERRYQRIVVLHEAMTRFVLPLCSHLSAPTPISSVTTIIDLEQVSLSAMWSLRSHLQVASAMATANYPETLNTIAIVNSPSFFPTIWNWIKTWFDEGTRNKIHILSKNPGPTLRSLIDEKDIPQSYGGQLPWKFEDDPNLDDAIKEVIGEMPKGPILFVDGSMVKP